MKTRGWKWVALALAGVLSQRSAEALPPVTTAAPSNDEAVLRKQWTIIRVLCAAQEIKEGTLLVVDMVTVCEIPERFVTDS
jgi:hypothetical protein